MSGNELGQRVEVEGRFHACALTYNTFLLYCWGANQYGQIGDGTTVDRASAVRVDLPAVPLDSRHLSVGASHTCALTGSGQAYCWGRNDDGQLGDGTTTSRSIPTPVAGGFSFTSIAAGTAHTCGVLTDGRAVCWGSNVSAQLGSSEFGSRRLVPTVVSGQRIFATIAAGGAHSCAVEPATKRAYCWGLNSDGQLGDGTTTSRSVPTRVTDYQP